MRIGELLVLTGQLTSEQLEKALRTQVLWGGRLGSVLVELGMMELEGLTRALASQHQMPAALASHFAQVMPELQQRLPAAVAALWHCVPITRLPGESGRIAVAVMSPLSAAAIDEIAAHLGVESPQLLIGIAAEMRVRYHLEVAYRIARDQRYLRSRSEKQSTPPPVLDVELDFDEPISDVSIEIPLTSSKQDSAIPTSIEIPEPSSEIYDAEAPPEVADPKAQRRYVHTFGDEPTAPSADRPALGRIAIRKAVVAAGDVAMTVDEAILPTKFNDAMKAIRRGTNRDKVARLAMQATNTFVTGVHTTAFFILRGTIAIGWKANRSGVDCSDNAANIVLPLDRDNVATAAVSRGACVELARSSAHNELDLKLFDAFLDESSHQLANENRTLLVAPIMIKEQPVCLLFGVGSTLADGARRNFDQIIASVSTAFLRLMKSASR